MGGNKGGGESTAAWQVGSFFQLQEEVDYDYQRSEANWLPAEHLVFR